MFEDLRVELARIEKKAEKEQEDTEYSKAQAIRLVEICKDTTNLKKQACVDEKAQFEAQLRHLDVE